MRYDARDVTRSPASITTFANPSGKRSRTLRGICYAGSLLALKGRIHASRHQKILEQDYWLTGEGTILLGLTSKECELISRIHSRRLTYLSDKRLASLANTCRSIQNARLSGIFLKPVVRLVDLPS